MYFLFSMKGLSLPILRASIVFALVPDVSVACKPEIYFSPVVTGILMQQSARPELVSKHSFKEYTVFIYRSESINNPFTIKIHGKTMSRDFVIIETPEGSKKYSLVEHIGGLTVPTKITWDSIEQISVEDLKEYCNGILMKKQNAKT